MLMLALLPITGIVAGLLLLRTAPTLPATHQNSSDCPTVTVIIPARNEAANLPPLLDSLRISAFPPLQIIVVDDHSTDATASIATIHGATVLPSSQLPAVWTGKTWACHQGAQAAAADLLFFLDADTWFTADGYARTIAFFTSLPRDAALSILPFHRTQRWYEELSLFFNILVAMGAGGFGKLDPPHLFGHSMLLRADLYKKAGGHASVKREILENLHFAAHLRATGGTPRTLAGRGILETRMFPHGFSQLRESWTKAFATGAGSTSPLVLVLSILWLASALLAALNLANRPNVASAAIYFITAAQIAWYARQLGSFRIATALLYPISLIFYFVVFTQSLLHRVSNRPVTWRGRRL